MTGEAVFEGESGECPPLRESQGGFFPPGEVVVGPEEVVLAFECHFEKAR